MSLGRNLRTFCESHGVAATTRFFRDARREGRITEHQISLRDLAEGLLGPAWATRLQGRRVGLQEAGTEGVDASAFTTITGQLMVDKINEKYQSADFIGLKLVETLPVTNGNLGTHKIPWLSRLTSEPSKLQPGEHYPNATYQPEYIELPACEKYGLVAAATFEHIYSDLTGQVYESCGDVGDRIGQWQEEKLLNCILGFTNNFYWNGTNYNTYLTSGNWINKQASTPLTDWTSVNQAEQLFSQMTDPKSGKPIKIKPNGMIVMPWRYYNAKRILSATETRSGDITTGDGNQTLAKNPLEADYPVYKSTNAYKLLVDSGLTATQAREYWLVGDFHRAFVWRSVYPLKIVEAPPNNPAEFQQDIAYQVKASLFGIAGIRDPRYVVLMYST